MLLNDNNYAANNQILGDNLHNMNMYSNSSTPSQVDYGVQTIECSDSPSK
jgi:hypothetical protein